MSEEVERAIVNPTPYCNWALTSYDDLSGLLVGSHPCMNDDKQLDALVKTGVTVFVSCCTTNEMKRYGEYEETLRKGYPTKDFIFLSLPSNPKKVPDETKLYSTASTIFEYIVRRRLVYIHSVNGCGRANVLAGYVIMFDPHVKDTSRPIDILEMSQHTRTVKPKPNKLESKEQYSIFTRFPTLLQEDMKWKNTPDQRMKSEFTRRIAEKLKSEGFEQRPGESVQDLIMRSEREKEEMEKRLILSDPNEMPGLVALEEL